MVKKYQQHKLNKKGGGGGLFSQREDSPSGEDFKSESKGEAFRVRGTTETSVIVSYAQKKAQTSAIRKGALLFSKERVRYSHGLKKKGWERFGNSQRGTRGWDWKKRKITIRQL